MNDKLFLTPKLSGSRFDDHTLPISILEDFTALEELLIEVAKGIYLEENLNRRRIPKGFSESIYLKLVSIEEGSSVAKFAIANVVTPNSPLIGEIIANFTYFEKAKNKIISIIETFNTQDSIIYEDAKYLSFFNKIGKNLFDDESIDFGYNFYTKESSKAILNKITRKKILLSRKQKIEYSDTLKLYALIPSINQKENKFSIQLEDNVIIECDLTDKIRDNVFSAFNEYISKSYVALKGTGIFNGNDKILGIEEIESVDILDKFDVSLRMNSLSKLKDNWYEGTGKAPQKNLLLKFNDFFDTYFDNNLPLPAIFPTLEGNIQLEWKYNHKNIILEIELDSLFSNFYYYNDKNETDEIEKTFLLNSKEGWTILNSLMKTIQDRI